MMTGGLVLFPHKRHFCYFLAPQSQITNRHRAQLDASTSVQLPPISYPAKNEIILHLMHVVRIFFMYCSVCKSCALRMTKQLRL